LEYARTGKGGPYYIINNNIEPSLFIKKLKAELPASSKGMRVFRDKKSTIVSQNIP